jgi:hypothetical protein
VDELACFSVASRQRAFERFAFFNRKWDERNRAGSRTASYSNPRARDENYRLVFLLVSQMIATIQSPSHEDMEFFAAIVDCRSIVRLSAPG